MAAARRRGVRPTASRLPQTWGLLAQYDSPAALLAACARVREAGIARFDACVPFPVHGLDRAMGLSPSPLPWIVLVIGVVGSLAALGFQIWTMAYDFPIIVSGKPLWSVPAFVPIWFELTVLTSCLTIFFGNWALCRLPALFHPTFSSRAFERVTDDGFFVIIEASDPRFETTRCRALLAAAGAIHIEEIRA